jgi:hypothetical protein
MCHTRRNQMTRTPVLFVTTVVTSTCYDATVSREGSMVILERNGRVICVAREPVRFMFIRWLWQQLEWLKVL